MNSSHGHRIVCYGNSMSELIMNNRNRNNNSERITVTLDRKVYDHLKHYGRMGDTYSKVIERILREKEGSEMNSIDGGSF